MFVFLHVLFIQFASINCTEFKASPGMNIAKCPKPYNNHFVVREEDNKRCNATCSTKCAAAGKSLSIPVCYEHEFKPPFLCFKKTVRGDYLYDEVKGKCVCGSNIEGARFTTFVPCKPRITVRYAQSELMCEKMCKSVSVFMYDNRLIFCYENEEHDYLKIEPLMGECTKRTDYRNLYNCFCGRPIKGRVQKSLNPRLLDRGLSSTVHQKGTGPTLRYVPVPMKNSSGAWPWWDIDNSWGNTESLTTDTTITS